MAIIPVWLMVSEKQRPYVSMYPPTPEQVAASTTNDSFWGRVKYFEVHIPIADAVKVKDLIVLSPTALLEVIP